MFNVVRHLEVNEPVNLTYRVSLHGSSSRRMQAAGLRKPTTLHGPGQLGGDGRGRVAVMTVRHTERTI